MSSLGCSYDNAALKTFFEILETERLYRPRFSSRAEVEPFIAEYVDLYNLECISLKNGLTPVKLKSKAVKTVFSTSVLFFVCPFGKSPF